MYVFWSGARNNTSADAHFMQHTNCSNLQTAKMSTGDATSIFLQVVHFSLFLAEVPVVSLHTAFMTMTHLSSCGIAIFPGRFQKWICFATQFILAQLTVACDRREQPYSRATPKWFRQALISRGIDKEHEASVLDLEPS